VEDAVLPAVILELEHANVSVGRGASEKAAGLVRGPRYDVDAGLVEGEIEDALPCAVLLPPDENFSVVACARLDVAVFGVRPGYAPDGAFVTVVQHRLTVSISPSTHFIILLLGDHNIPLECLD